MSAPPISTATSRLTACALLLPAGVAFGVVSVFSSSRAACAVWVVLSMMLVLMAGIMLGRAPRTRL